MSKAEDIKREWEYVLGSFACGNANIGLTGIDICEAVQNGEVTKEDFVESMVKVFKKAGIDL
jgi:hypothetical protein